MEALAKATGEWKERMATLLVASPLSKRTPLQCRPLMAKQQATTTQLTRYALL